MTEATLTNNNWKPSIIRTQTMLNIYRSTGNLLEKFVENPSPDESSHRTKAIIDFPPSLKFLVQFRTLFACRHKCFKSYFTS
ncbi:CLUMA_CG003736, isoform A [Clunio marinus]|uniref:CLUMA_CG003736, isoform A n=1 Tax=Clunio marinus TaxID=568069 RepID=A0A1J1HV25_9DIPT|nr:CLUMA_CG003736, isoform A [Clunio marinus]